MSAKSTRLLTDNAKGAAIATISKKKKRAFFFKRLPQVGPSLCGFREQVSPGRVLRTSRCYKHRAGQHWEPDFLGLPLASFLWELLYLSTDDACLPHILSQAAPVSTMLGFPCMDVRSPSACICVTAKAPPLCACHAFTFLHRYYPKARPGPAPAGDAEEKGMKCLVRHRVIFTRVLELKGTRRVSGDLIPNEKTGPHEIRHSSVPVNAHSCSSSE